MPSDPVGDDVAGKSGLSRLDWVHRNRSAWCSTPLLGILKLKARDIVSYGVLQLIVHVPLVFFLCWLFARYIPYLPPIT